MARGNQRDKAREKNLKEQGNAGKKMTGDPNKRREDNAKALQDKIAAKKALAEATANGAK